MRTPKAIVFDFDLTLADSRAGIAACHAYAMRELELPDADTRVSLATAMIGTPLDIVFAKMFPESNALEAYVGLYHSRADEIMTASTSLMPGVRKVIAELHGQGVLLAIVSVKLRSRIVDFLYREGLLSSFTTIIGPEDAPASKPDPSGLLLALDRLGISSEEALYVGDTLIDAETALRAGVPFVALLSGFTSAAEFEAHQPMAVLDGVADLPALFGG